MEKLVAWMREPDYVESANLEWLLGWVNRRPLKELADLERKVDIVKTQQRVTQVREQIAEPVHRDWHYDSQGYCDNPGRGY